MESKIDWGKMGGLVPAIIQDAHTCEVLMLGFMNKEALLKTLELGKVTFWSRSRQTLWTKGETSGNFLNVVSLSVDCDRDSLLILANPVGPTCHNGTHSCFEKTVRDDHPFLKKLGSIIQQRHQEMPEDSYTTTLFLRGLDRIAQKVGEEAIETVIASKNEDQGTLINETSDLIYHLLVLLEYKKLSLREICSCLEQRHK